jgi:hypothetical protein
MAISVILQALRDMRELAWRRHQAKYRRGIVPQDLLDAERFLFLPVGGYRDSRHLWCELAGVDPEAFESRMARWRRQQYQGMNLDHEQVYLRYVTSRRPHATKIHQVR